MADDILAPVTLGFAEFAAQLVSEVFEAVALAQMEQQARAAEIAATASLAPAEFAERFVTAAQVDAELAQLFPTAVEKQIHAIFAGAPYTPAEKTIEESPPVLALLGIQLERSDYTVRRGEVTPPVILNGNGVQRIREAMRLRLASDRLLALRELVAQGIPRVLVDAGRVNAKLTFQVTQVTETDDAPQPGRNPLLNPKLRPLGSLTSGMTGQFGRTVIPPELRNVRLAVNQVSDRAPQTTTAETDIYGEVEITFKTVV